MPSTQQDRICTPIAYLLFEVSIVVHVGNDEVQVVFDAETVFDAAHRRRQWIVGQVHAYRYADACSAVRT